MTWQIITADVIEGLASLPDESVQTVVTSPPYWGLRDYGTGEWEGGDAACDHMMDRFAYAVSEKQASNAASGSKLARDACGKCGAVRVDKQLGLEPTPEEYVARIVEVFREVRRVLRRDGTCWVNLGDTYNSRLDGSHGGWNGSSPEPQRTKNDGAEQKPRYAGKPKDLVGIPWRVAFALQADGWYLRSDVIWSKPNPMPESVTDRPTKAHEYVFLLTRAARYFYDADGVREPQQSLGERHEGRSAYRNGHPTEYGYDHRELNPAGRNLRSVWSIPTEPFPEAHFATFPKALVVPCVKAGTSEKGCCPECGTAWVRVQEATANGQTVTVQGGTRQTGLTQDHAIGRGERGSFNVGEDGVTERRTVGWTPSCLHCEKCLAWEDAGASWPRPCSDHEPVPCTVLDPFCGSGTVGVVALRHGRSFVGIELNPEYAEMARRRIADDAPLFNVPAEVP